MANNDVVYTNKYIKCAVDFINMSAYLLFTVLPSCPLFLGLSFFALLNLKLIGKTCNLCSAKVE